MNISTVDLSGAIAGVPAAVTEPKKSLDSPQAYPESTKDREASQKDTQEIVEKMQEQIDSINVSIQYSTYGDRGEKVTVAVVNKKTGEMIREIPSKELRTLYAKMNELAGMIFNREI